MIKSPCRHPTRREILSLLGMAAAVIMSRESAYARCRFMIRTAALDGWSAPSRACWSPRRAASLDRRSSDYDPVARFGEASSVGWRDRVGALCRGVRAGGLTQPWLQLAQHGD